MSQTLVIISRFVVPAVDYEQQGEALPSIEIARKIADILDVSLDYLTGKVDVEMDKNTRNRILEVTNSKKKTVIISSLLSMLLSLKEKSSLFCKIHLFSDAWQNLGKKQTLYTPYRPKEPVSNIF